MPAASKGATLRPPALPYPYPTLTLNIYPTRTLRLRHGQVDPFHDNVLHGVNPSLVNQWSLTAAAAAAAAATTTPPQPSPPPNKPPHLRLGSLDAR